ncbi:hypothetical protein [Aurantiacibacter marinus]|uniref:Uncharacterized protein n=1 Tax=Aurantiacibacter marinus TaxID=874156 RepID=A0A0H0XNK0_9SPHN|nr:hypothetical protein [Aurantiacibacter marinus]KLI63522.1 hypothetical protein AAV99_07080 [Aurantiacibacter marinus]
MAIFYKWGATMIDHDMPKALKVWTTPACVDCDKTATSISAAAGPAGFDGGAFPNSYATS